MNQHKIHILVGIDFSDSSMMALQHALKLATHTHARLHLCYIAKGEGFVVDTNLGLNIPATFAEAKEARFRLQRMLGLLGADIDSEVHVRMGNSPVLGLLALIKEIKPDFVVVCSHGKGVIKRTLLGSVSHALAQRSPVPVLIVPTPGREELLNQPEPPVEPELPAVGRAVADSDEGSAIGCGIASIGGGALSFR